MTLLTRIQTESILLESDIKELIDILISPSIGTDIKYELLSSYSEREIQQQELNINSYFYKMAIIKTNLIP